MPKVLTKITESLLLLALLIVGAYVGSRKLAVYYCNRGINYYNDGLYKEAIASYKTSLKIDPVAPVVHYNLAYAYERSAMADEALEEYKKAIYIDPNDMKAYSGAARVYWKLKKYREAFDFLNQAREKFPGNDDLGKLAGSLSFEFLTGSLDDAVEAFSDGKKKEAYDLLFKAQQIKPDFAYTYYTLAFLYYAEQKYKQAQDNLDRALQLDPRFWPAYKLSGDICAEKGSYAQAINKYAAAANINTHDALLYNDLGIALMRMERYRESAAYLKTASRLDPENLSIRHNLANVYKDAKMFDEAVVEFREIIARQPAYPNVHNDLAESYSAQGKDSEALREYNRQIELSRNELASSPAQAVTLNSLAFAYNGFGDKEKARGAINKAISIEPSYAQAYITLAKIQEESGDHQAALRSLEKARSLWKQARFLDRDIVRLKKEYIQAADSAYLKTGKTIK